MIETRAAAKVGLMVLVGLTLLLAAWWFLSHMSLNRYRLSAVFNDTKGLQPQTPLRMNGVAIGEVEKVALDRGTLKPRVTLSIADEYRNRIPRDSAIHIASGLLISNPQIEITPGAATDTYQPGDIWVERYVEREPASSLAQISPDADRAV